MNGNKKPFDWIKLNNRKQCEWAARYLQKHGREYTVSSRELREEDIEYMNNIFGENPAASMTLLLLKMKNAWTQKNSRDQNNGRKPYSFVMDTGIKKKLKNIANGNNINRTLELLIEDTDKFKKNLEEQKESYKEEIEAKLESQQGRANDQIQKLKVQIEKLEKAKEIQNEYIERLVIEMLTYRTVLHDNNLEDKEPTPEQQLQIQKDRDTEIHQLNVKIKTHVQMIRWY